MKKIAALATVGIIGLAGCGATNVPTSTVTVTATPVPTTPPPAPTPTITPEEAYIAAVESKYGPLSSKQERTAIDFAQDVCVTFDTVGVKKGMRYYAYQVTTAKEAKFVGFLIGAGVQSFCPEYSDDLGLGVNA